MTFFLLLTRNLLALKTSRYYTFASVFNSPFNLLRLLNLSSTNEFLQLTKQTHAQVLFLGFTQSPFLASKLFSLYPSFGHLTESKTIFDSVEDKSLSLELND
ncbi:hypothetical protein GQ457_18G007640 [Hibiscus cannabinus]